MIRDAAVSLTDVQKQLQFETFVTDCAARFTEVRLPVDLEQRIEASLQSVVEFFGAHHCALFGGAPGEAVSWITCSAHRPGAVWPEDAKNFALAFPWQFAHLCQTTAPVAVVQLSDVPAEAEQDWRTAESLGIRSMLAIAVHGPDDDPHCLLIQSLHCYVWPAAYVSRLVVLTQVFANALRRDRLDRTRQVAAEHADVLQAVGAIVWRADARTFQTTFVSKEAETILGYPVESWVKIPGFWRDHIHPNDRAWVEAYTMKAVQERRMHDFEYRMVVANGRTVWLRNIVKVLVEHGEPVALVGATVDITERKRAEFEAAQLREQLARAMRVQSLGEMTATLAHELNQPLGAIVSNAETAQMHLMAVPPAIEPLHAIVADITRDAHRAADIVHRVNLLLQQQAFDMKPVDANQLVHAVAGLVRALIESRHIELTVDLEPGLQLCADSVQIQQVLLNLLLNAIDAVRDRQDGARRILIQGAQHGAEIHLSVSDTGPGVAAAELPRLFEPFYTTRVGGLGLGLPICKTIVEAHGGTIEIVNNRDGGATVRVWLRAANHHHETLG